MLIGGHFLAPPIKNRARTLHLQRMEKEFDELIKIARAMGADTEHGGQAVIFGGSDYHELVIAGKIGATNIQDMKAYLQRYGITNIDESQAGGRTNRYAYFDGHRSVVITEFSEDTEHVAGVPTKNHIVQFQQPATDFAIRSDGLTLNNAGKKTNILKRSLRAEERSS